MSLFTSAQEKQILAIIKRVEMNASNNYKDAAQSAIADLEKAKEKLLVSEKHLSAANNKLEGLTVKKLTRKNPTMKAKFEELKAGEDD